MRVGADVGHDEGEIRQRVVLQIGGELGERDDAVFLGGAVAHVAEVGERVVVLEVVAGIAPGVSGVGKAFGVGLPGFAGAEQVADDVVSRDGAGVAVVVGDLLPGSAL